MYAGRVVEGGVPDEVLSAPRHPFTQALLDEVPSGLERRDRKRSILPVKAGGAQGGGCFRPYCRLAEPVGADQDPAMRPFAPGQGVACLLVS